MAGYNIILLLDRIRSPVLARKLRRSKPRSLEENVGLEQFLKPKALTPKIDA